MGEKYIAERLDPQIAYYDKKSGRSQQMYYFFSITNIIILALIPVVSLTADDFLVVKYVVALAGAIASIITSILMVKKYKESWLEFRTTCEALKSEREKYRYCGSQYKGLPSGERDALFVDRCEEIMSAERSSWSTRMKQNDTQK